MRTTTNFRLTDESRKILAALSAEWHMSQRAVVEKLLRDADPRGGVTVARDPRSGPLSGGAEVTEKRRVEPTVARGSLKRKQAIPKPDWKK